MVDFAYYLYYSKQSERISISKLLVLIHDIYSSDPVPHPDPHSSREALIIKRVKDQGLPQDGLSLDMFQILSKHVPEIFGPFRVLQKEIRERLLGRRLWERYGRRRSKMKESTVREVFLEVSPYVFDGEVFHW
eukprot:CAMPEP_0182440122 /NCGR_PEP_ID=MMETSP1167-20130531/86849_1 /TAXON_ID=2988 /ORGANISM="Mallomonas Sp, Strain CCMP3275" /LENGTH=132 /DNA_ID=CAMNT_0024633987 /DNA_START=615 /DNA_END=1010 /DNA_ORIENTATION=-